jgi:hypothetical protein
LVGIFVSEIGNMPNGNGCVNRTLMGDVGLNLLDNCLL